MLVIPAIDLKDGQCVRLRQGRMEDSTVFSDDPASMAGIWQAKGARRLHIVDLNGAFAGTPVNAEIITKIAAAYPDLPIQIGGGIRNLDSVGFYLDAGVSYVIIGTQAVKNPEFVREACLAYPSKIIVGIDAIEGMVATEGWADVSDVSAVTLAEKFADFGVEAIVYTDINCDGMMRGVNLEATKELADHSPIPVIASGGVSKLADIAAIRELSEESCGGGIMGVITGRAIYEESLDLTLAQQLCDE
ncbi:MAG: 1-(5-phosphoribosyl)-5-[(5-phosphoribosylamino)methylideneamino]imidazole-4-carboxamide isomerase [Gammaproteobacteria bacterium]|jgi:phosphoribosylformimino-5-aminoimidazole carboxamide ribotide isomerase|nr:1-(5-phosphoribosyl)-5-[(5-phosphoribosylamino)methylideneamino]imidazole-4-carboxamide isomerase [Gammaproteobacteria bacterium]MDG2336423.1 1-(5-phosphoribosyl)-5-[(5-phosphoribosylamino)methylideneamino]imidazole-4-carboxamide isomerase [Gammaproteobacteria bacterium]